MPGTELKSTLDPYQDIAKHLKIPKADLEMCVHMEWEKKDLSKILTRDDVQALYEKEKDHPGLAADVHNRFQYKDILNILAPILSIKEETNTMEPVDPVKLHIALNAAIKLGANALYNMNQERRDRIWRKDPINKNLKDFH